MITAVAALRGLSPMSFSKVVESPKGSEETSATHEERTWRERMHITEEGFVYVPPNMLKNSLSAAATFLSKPVPGKGKATYTKNFEAGVMCLDPMVLAIKGTDVPSERLFVPSDGRRGGKSRVWKIFPRIETGWEGVAEYKVLNALITEPVFREHLEECGKYIGFGRFRPRNNGYYGRFEVLWLEWKES